MMSECPRCGSTELLIEKTVNSYAVICRNCDKEIIIVGENVCLVNLLEKETKPTLTGYEKSDALFV